MYAKKVTQKLQCLGLRHISKTNLVYDHIVVGAGAAGSIVSSGLAERGSNVLLVDAQSQFTRSLRRVLRTCPGGFNGPKDQALWACSNAMEYDSWAQAAQSTSWQHSELDPLMLSNASRFPHTEPPCADSSFEEFLRTSSDLGFAQYVGTAVGQTGSGVGYFPVLHQQWAQDAFLQPAIDASGPDGQQLSILRGVQVSRVKLSNGRAVGVEWDGGSAVAGEVVLCCGTLGSAQLLMCSGIGQRHRLERSNIHVAQELPGVGANVQDKVGFSMQFLDKQASASWPMSRGMDNCSLPASHTVAGGYMKSCAKEQREDLHIRIEGQLSLGRRRNAIGVWLLKPTVRSQVLLEVGHPSGPPSLQASKSNSELDIEKLANGAARVSKILERVSSASLSRDAPLEKKRVQQYLQPAGQPIGSCAMGQGREAVVDGELRVHGIAGLRVADASVMPSNASADMQASMFAVAKQAVHLIANGGTIQGLCRFGMSTRSASGHGRKFPPPVHTTPAF